MRIPVEVARINDAAANGSAMAIHVFRGGMRNDVGAPFDGTAVDGRRERVVNDQRYAVIVRRLRKALDIEHREMPMRAIVCANRL